MEGENVLPHVKQAVAAYAQSHQLEESGQLAYLGGPACDVL